MALSNILMDQALRAADAECETLKAELFKATVSIRKHEEALAWVIEHFNTFAQPPDHLKAIVDDACLKAMTADEDAVKATVVNRGVAK